MKQHQFVFCPVCRNESEVDQVDGKWEFAVLRCQACTVEFSDPLKSDPEDPRVREGYSRRLDLVGSYIGWFHRAFIGRKLHPGGKLLELGCGTGDFVQLAVTAGYEAVGVDLDAEAIEVGRKHWGSDRLYGMTASEYLKRNPGARFDFVCFFEVIEHLTDPHAFLDEIRKYLAPNGYIVLSTPNNGSPLLKLWRRATRVIDYPPHHVFRWNRKALETCLRPHGFEVVHYETCAPSISDIVADWAKLSAPPQLSTKTMQRAVSVLNRALGPVNSLMPSFVSEGRSQLVIARVERPS